MGSIRPPILQWRIKIIKIYISTLSSASQNIHYKEVIKEYLNQNTASTNALLALNTAFSWDGAFVYIPNGAVLQYPILITSVATQNAVGHSFHPTNLIIAGENSHATIIEAYQHNESGHSFYNTFTTLHIQANAVLEYYKIQTGKPGYFHIGNTQARLERNANLSAQAINLSGQLVRNNLDVSLDGEGAHAELRGLYVLDEKEQVG